LLPELKNTLQKNSVSQTFNNKIFIITGELSGEMHAAHLVKSLKDRFHFQFSAVGGKRLMEEGADVICDYQNISITGISELLSKITHIYRAWRIVKKHIRETRPALVILVDFPGFNLSMARFAKKLGIPVLYFIAPQIWAWKKKRIETMERCVDRVICILPFEKALYDQHGIDSVYVGHPFVNMVKPSLSREVFLEQIHSDGSGPIITIMPGSRQNEIIKHLPVLLKIVAIMKKSLPGMVVVLPLAENIEPAMLAPFRGSFGDTVIIKKHAYDALAYCDTAIVASGSVTLEAAILKAPTIVIYQISSLSYLIAKMLVKIEFISLPNIIAGKEVFPEFIQDLDPEKIAEKALYMVHNGKEAIQEEINGIIEKLGHYNSYESARDAVIEFLEKKYGTLS
jgi:lipid-A-disaccharide synthase